MKQLLFSKMQDDDDMSAHLNNFSTAVDKLKEMGLEVSGDLLTILMLYSVPSTYENFRCAIEARDDLPDTETLKIKLIEEANARKGVIGNRDSSEALYVKNWENKNQTTGVSIPHRGTRTRGQNWGTKCDYCGKQGHRAAACWKKIADQHKASNAEEEEEALIACLADSRPTNTNGESASIVAAMTASGLTEQDWCLDSGATSHMCHNIQEFIEIAPVENQTVRLAVDKVTDVKGKGTVRLAVSTTKGKKSVRLENALYVPKLKTNLLSVSKATTSGRCVFFNESKASIRSANGKIIAEAHRRGDLYFISPTEEIAATVERDGDN